MQIKNNNRKMKKLIQNVIKLKIIVKISQILKLNQNKTLFLSAIIQMHHKLIYQIIPLKLTKIMLK